MQWLMLTVGLGGIVLTAGIGIFSLLGKNFILGSFFLIALYLALGFRTVQQQERRLVEFFGVYFMTLRPTPPFGIRWILPGAMKIRARINIWEQRVSLFEQPVKIDFRDGSATPKGAEAFVRIKNPDEVYQVGPDEERRFVGDGVFRAIYNIANWRTALRDLLENAIRTYLNTLTIDEGITQARAGFDLRNRLPPEEHDRLQETLARWGFELTQLTITDFDLEPELVKARGEVQMRQRAAEAARHEALIRARETMGALIGMLAEILGQTVEEVQGDVAANPKLKARLQKVAEDLVSRQVSIAGRALTDIRVSGAGDLGNAIMALLAAFKKA